MPVMHWDCTFVARPDYLASALVQGSNSMTLADDYRQQLASTLRHVRQANETAPSRSKRYIRQHGPTFIGAAALHLSGETWTYTAPAAASLCGVAARFAWGDVQHQPAYRGTISLTADHGDLASTVLRAAVRNLCTWLTAMRVNDVLMQDYATRAALAALAQAWTDYPAFRGLPPGVLADYLAQAAPTPTPAVDYFAAQLRLAAFCGLLI